MPEVVVPQGLDDEGPYSEIVVPEYFPSGSIMLFETHLQELDADLDAFCASGAQEAFGDLDLVDLNVVLYRALTAKNRMLARASLVCMMFLGWGRWCIVGWKGGCTR